MRMNYIISYARNGKVPHNANAEKNEVTRICRAKESITCALDLADVKLEHLLLYLADDTAEYICNG